MVGNTATITETGDSDDASVTVNCYDLSVTKDANTTWQRKYFWNILKSSDDPNGSSLLLDVDEVYADYPYSVTVDVDHQVDSAWAVSGTITIANNHPSLAAELTSVTDEVSTSIGATVDCSGVTSVPAGGSIDCTYSTALPAGTDRTNTATATQQLYDYATDGTATAGGTKDYTGTADVIFGDPTTVIDEMVGVSDTYEGTLGNCDVASAPCTYNYSRTFGPFGSGECGTHTFPNTASFTTNDTTTSGESSWTVTVTVPCPGGCTLTQGYWKTHSDKGPAPYDATWAFLPDGADTPFFDLGQSWYQVFWTPPKGGNANFILAHQYMAAYLNQLGPDGAASTPEVDAAMAAATDYFTNLSSLNHKPTGSERRR